MTIPDFYHGREQSFVKHEILKNYLVMLAHIIGFTNHTSVAYVDCFSGPWKEATENFEDTSFDLAIRQLLEAQKFHKQRDKNVDMRCLFLEIDPAAYKRLSDYALQFEQYQPELEVETLNKPFEKAIEDIRYFVNKRPNTFSFFFIDPTGWSGFGMDQIEPLLKMQSGEVMINFMTSFISRFIEHPAEETQQSFENLFGSSEYRELIQNIPQAEREDKLVSAYANNIKSRGGYKAVCTAIILNPLLNRTHFHLIYATRHILGVKKFKETEKKAMKAMEAARADAQQRKRESQGQLTLFESEEMHDGTYFDELRERYLNLAKNQFMQMLQANIRLPYDKAFIEILQTPLIWESDLKSWIEDWQKQGILKIEGLVGKERTPKIRNAHALLWFGQ